MSDLHKSEDLSAALGAQCQPYVAGEGGLEPVGSTLRFVTVNATSRRYSNAQIDDYQGLSRRCFLWRPPTKLTIRARFSHPTGHLQGTAGFGFWNDPFLMTGARMPALPRAVWFFYASPPSNMKLDLPTAGHGWKAATIDALHPSALLWAPFAPFLVPLMNSRRIYRRLWPRIQHTLKIRQALVSADMTAWCTYTIEWGTESVKFGVAGTEDNEAKSVLHAPSPGGPLGFVAWLDNQYLVITPWGRLAWGILEVPGRQWMEVDRLVLEPL